MSGDVYGQDGAAADVTGKVIILNGSLVRELVELGTVENGKLALTFPDIPAPEELQRPDWFYNNGGDFNAPDVKIEPEDATWMYLNEQRPIYILTDEEIEGAFGSVEKATYRMELRCVPENVTAQFIYFTRDTSITAKGELMMMNWDIAIKGRKGWNLVYVTTEDETSLKITSSGKEVTDIQWIAIPSQRSIIF